MHGTLKLSIKTDALNVESVWTDLSNPELDPKAVERGVEGIAEHPSTVLRARGPDAFATVRIDGRDWGKVLSVGRLGGRVIACKTPGLQNECLVNRDDRFRRRARDYSLCISLKSWRECGRVGPYGMYSYPSLCND